jgi:hypothetical protein
MPKAKPPTLLDRMSDGAIRVAVEPFMDEGTEFECLASDPPYYSYRVESQGTLLSVTIKADDEAVSALRVLHKGHSIVNAEFNQKGGSGFVNYGERRIPTTFVEGELMDWLRRIDAAARSEPGQGFTLGTLGPTP